MGSHNLEKREVKGNDKEILMRVGKERIQGVYGLWDQARLLNESNHL